MCPILGAFGLSRNEVVVSERVILIYLLSIRIREATDLCESRELRGAFIVLWP